LSEAGIEADGAERSGADKTESNGTSTSDVLHAGGRSAVAIESNGHGNGNGAANGHGNGHGNGNGIAAVALQAASAAIADTMPPGDASIANSSGSATHGNGSLSNGVGANGHGAIALDGRPIGPERDSPVGRTGPPIRDAVFRRLLAVGDLLAALGGLAILALLSGQGIAAASLASVPLIVVLAKILGRYDHDHVVLRKSTLDELPRLLALAASYALVWSLIASIAGLHAPYLQAGVVALWFATSFLLVLTRASARALAQMAAPPERALIVGTPEARAVLAHALACDPGAHVDVVGVLTLEEERPDDGGWDKSSSRGREPALDDLDTVIRDLNVQRVFLIPPSGDSEMLLEAVTRMTSGGVKLSVVPRLFEVVGSSVEFDVVGGVTVLGVRRPVVGHSSLAIKRAIDFFGSAFGLLVLAPFGALVALAIKLDSRGPVFFRQPRIGRNGERFYIIKFRSMVDGAEAQREALAALNESDGIFKLSADPRVTRVGRWLRRTSLDELPQLINVLNGEMSLVGPRPLVADEDVLIEGRHRDRLQFTPGMTGMWQVLGPSRPPLSEMVKLDYMYAANWSLWTDIKILLRTLSHVIGQRGV
jgi:exopolysaccharide biosynthesis polyprenyl glycosylphosphotransferase